ncbi:MAG TPA: hypothetical protein VN040_03375 [Pseudosphingobacterium sp.]|nr:hypothetical protein [Pseudosphingobacterium sp.]
METPKPAPVQAPAEISRTEAMASIGGEWKGKAQELGNGKQYEMRLSINPANHSFKVAYPELGCSGIWDFSENDRSDLSFKEIILNGVNNCVQGILIKLIIKNVRQIECLMYYPSINNLVAKTTLFKQ